MLHNKVRKWSDHCKKVQHLSDCFLATSLIWIIYFSFRSTTRPQTPFLSLSCDPFFSIRRDVLTPKALSRYRKNHCYQARKTKLFVVKVIEGKIIQFSCEQSAVPLTDSFHTHELYTQSGRTSASFS